MPFLTVSHTTVYRYGEPVGLGEHRMMFRPRASHDLRLIGVELAITPRPAHMRWLHDPFDNSVAVATFEGTTSELRFESTVTLEHLETSLPEYPLEEYARTYPFRYSDEDFPNLERGLTHHYPDVTVAQWALQFLDPADTTADKLRDIPMTLPDGSIGYYTTGSYAANGLIPWHRANVKHLGDNTIVFAERPQVCKTSTGHTVYNLWGVGFYSPHMPAFAALAPLESPESWTTGQVSPVWPLPAEADADEIRVRIGREDAVPLPQYFRYPIQRIRNNEPCDPRLPGSMHSNGMNCLMSDGSVKVFSYRTSPWVFWSACVPTSVE